MENIITGNTSFIEMSEKLKEIGIKNHDFMLKTCKDYALSELNRMDLLTYPVGNNVVYDECKENIWFYLREILRLPYADTMSSFILNEANMAAIFCLENGKSVYLNSPRQTYKTVSMLCWISYNLIFRPDEYCCVNIISPYKNTSRDLKELLSKIILQAFSRLKVKTISQEYLDSIMKKVNAIEVKTQLDSALKIPTEYSINLVTDAEFLNQDYVRNLNGITIYESVVGLDDILTNAIYTLDSSVSFRNIIYDNLDSSVPNNLGNLIYIKKHFYELGFGTEWYNQMCKNLNYNEDAIKREIMLDRY